MFGPTPVTTRPFRAVATAAAVLGIALTTLETVAAQPAPALDPATVPANRTSTMGQKFNPVADPHSVVTVGNTRLTFISKRILRVEWSPDGVFEDRASFAFVNRRLAPANLDGMSMGGTTGCTDGTFWVFYPDGGNKELAVEKIIISRPGHVTDPDSAIVEWTPGMRPSRNLGGTVRTLDGISGSCELEPGVLTRDGWTFIDDSKNLLFDVLGTDWPWAAPRRHPDAIDWYFFAYGDDYKGALADFTKVAGKIPLPPRYVLGSWWSRYWAYTDKELKDIVRQFNEHDVPLDVLVIDMDWHLDGWTGYTWNKDYFPDSAAFLKWCKDNHLFVTLNLHPADGVGKHEAQFAQFKAAMGITDREVYRVPFDCTDRLFIENYFKLLHHPEEAKGVDFWWMDWQQGKNTKIPGLDPLYWLNYLHWTDFERRSHQGLSLGGTGSGGTGLRPVQTPAPASAASAAATPGAGRKPAPPGTDYGDKRPLIFSRWGGLGNHRYQVGFSGDTYNNWESLAFQPYFTATAANVGYAYWSHDIGGHQPGPVGPELYARWIQYGIFSPVLRTHCGKRPDAERRIWAFPDEVFSVCREAFHLRYAMIPYTYTACRDAYDTGVSLCRPLYYDWPRHESAYAFTNQYLFGHDLMVAPVITPANPVSGVASADIWFPPCDGGWTDWNTGRVYENPPTPGVESRGTSSHGPVAEGTTARLSFALRDIPVFARGSAIIPMQPKMSRTGEKPTDPLILTVYNAGPNGPSRGKGRLYEDDGITSGYERGEHAFTKITHALSGHHRRITVHPAEGDFKGMLAERACEVRLPFVLPPESVSVGGLALARLDAPASEGKSGWWYDAERATLFVRAPRASVRTAVEFDIALSRLDDAPLRRGFIGQLDMIDDVAQILGKHAPAALTGASALRACLGTDPARAMLGAEALQRDWWSLLEAVGACHAPDAARESAQARLLGLSCDLALNADAQRAGRLAAAVTVGFAPRFDHGQDSPLTIAFRASKGWNLEGSADVSRRLQLGQTTTAGVTLASAGVPSQGRLETEVVIGDRSPAIRVRSHETFCPSINAWSLLGPFDMPEGDDLTAAFIDEARPVDLAATAKAPDGSIRKWIRWERSVGHHDDPRREFFVDFHKAFGKHHDDAVAYAVTHIDAPKASRVRFELGSDDGAVAWLNGNEVFRKSVQRGYAPRDDRFEADLKAGRNELLLKVSQYKGGWGFSVHIEDLAGRPADVTIA
ncbi:MAG: DUF5110 domain-containing protein [Planctomycetes bacterium]|nr:DUF5110 domain-containing protein [Planctomycetota bacterium]